MITKTPKHLDDLARTLPPILALPEAADMLRMSIRTLQRAIAARELVVIKKGPHRNSGAVVTRSELLRWMAERSC